MSKTTVPCEGLTKKGQLCQNRAKAGTDPPRCDKHSETALERIEATKARFIERLRAGDDVYRAAENVGKCTTTVYDWRHLDPDFDAAWTEAVGRYWDSMENELRQRAMHGWEEPVFYQGEVVGYVRRFDNRLGIELLRARRPEVFGRKVEVNEMQRDEKAETVVLKRLEDPEVFDAVVLALEPGDDE